MTPDTPDEFPELTPEHKARVIAYFRKQFTVEMLIEYIEDDVEKFPFEQVLAEVEAIEFAGASAPGEGSNGTVVPRRRHESCPRPTPCVG